METRSILVLLGLLVASAALADTYTWVDEGGVVHYADRPHPGARRIDIGEPNVSQSLAPRRTESQAGAEPQKAEPEAPFRYESLEIASPGAEQTLWNIAGVLSVSLTLTPPLQSGHRVRIYFDGKPQIVGSTRVQLDEVWRGVHNLQAEVLDETGKVLIRSQTNRFYVQQTTVKTRPSARR